MSSGQAGDAGERPQRVPLPPQRLPRLQCQQCQVEKLPERKDGCDPIVLRGPVRPREGGSRGCSGGKSLLWVQTRSSDPPPAQLQGRPPVFCKKGGGGGSQAFRAVSAGCRYRVMFYFISLLVLRRDPHLLLSPGCTPPPAPAANLHPSLKSPGHQSLPSCSLPSAGPALAGEACRWHWLRQATAASSARESGAGSRCSFTGTKCQLYPSH